MPRRYANYGANEGFTTLHQVSSVGAMILGISTLPFLYNLYKSRRSPLVLVDDPWGWGRSLEWATSSPPPRHNFVSLPRIRSESPAFDLHHPDIARSEYADTGANRDNLLDAGEDKGRTEHLDELGSGGQQGPDPGDR
jgi:cytochrome c oxidase subunit 1